MRSIKMFFAIFIMSVMSIACEPEELPQDQPQMDQTTDLDKTASGDQDNPIDDDRKGDD